MLNRFVHGTCDPAADLSTYRRKKASSPDYCYTCKPCLQQNAAAAAAAAAIAAKRCSTDDEPDRDPFAGLQDAGSLLDDYTFIDGRVSFVYL